MVNTLNMLRYIKTNNLQEDFPFKSLFPFQCPTHMTSSLRHYIYGFITWMKRRHQWERGDSNSRVKTRRIMESCWPKASTTRPPIMSVCSSLITTWVGSLLGKRLELLYPIKYILCNKNSKVSIPHARSLYLIDPSLEVTYILLLKKKID